MALETAKPDPKPERAPKTTAAAKTPSAKKTSDAKTDTKKPAAKKSATSAAMKTAAAKKTANVETPVEDAAKSDDQPVDETPVEDTGTADETPVEDAAKSDQPVDPPPVEDVTGTKNDALPATGRSQLPTTVENKIAAAVTAVVPETDDFHQNAIRYGRKIVKQARGLRATKPPLGGLSKETADKVAKAVTDALSA